MHKCLGIAFFPRDDASKSRAIDLQLIYAKVKKIRVLPVHSLVHHWLSSPEYTVGDVAICSIVTRLAIKLRLLEGASLDFIDTHRQIYGYEHFNHAHLVKKIKGDLYMTFGDTKLRLPNPEMALYSVQTLHIEFQPRPVNRREAQGETSERAPQRIASKRFARQHKPVWLGADPTREAPAHISYDEWQARQRHTLNPRMYPPFHLPYHPYGYYPPPPFIPIGDGPSGKAPRHSFRTYGERIEDEEQGFEQGRRSDASGFFYTQQHYNEQMAF